MSRQSTPKNRSSIAVAFVLLSVVALIAVGTLVPGTDPEEPRPQAGADAQRVVQTNQSRSSAQTPEDQEPNAASAAAGQRLAPTASAQLVPPPGVRFENEKPSTLEQATDSAAGAPPEQAGGRSPTQPRGLERGEPAGNLSPRAEAEERFEPLAVELGQADPLDPQTYREIMDAYRGDTREMLRQASAYQQDGDSERARQLVETWNNLTIEWRDRAYGRD